MLNVPSASFPVPSSQQRVSAGARSKVPLKPGRSLMDWIRVTKSGKDLTGLKGRLIEVSEEELAKHNKKDDCWMCIRGMVYNITPYMEYHPGGEEELMRAAGTDGTDLFDQVHRWVNYESMLKECLIGRMAVKLVSASKGTVSETKNEQFNGTELTPRYDWFQTDSTVTVVIYTKQKNIFSESVIVDHQENILRVESMLVNYSYLLFLELNHVVTKEITVHCTGKTGKIELVLLKEDPFVWKMLGQPLEGHKTFVKISSRGFYYRKCRLVSKTDINHNTKLFCFELPQGCHLHVPVGYHVYLKLNISGTDIVKPYTPVLSSLLPDTLSSQCNTEKCIYMMIKMYPNGSFTPHIDHLEIGDYIYLSNPQGDFQKSKVAMLEDVFLLAAGTGLTPMVKLLMHILTNVYSLRKLKLIFFNKTEDDILWREQIEQLCLADKRFESQFVLSEPTETWTGSQGQISHHLLSESLTRSKKESKVLICICGPNGFVDQGLRLLQDLGFSKEEVFVFRE
ncbi:cytochrome b5 reductase 4-like [Bombina bombina]|uniref:cytochrome b5 reductase 4-like n=1 Tax=Bombina bombina TaxID=8345 RepID=UPI00235B05F9|nr:cytochrome b5 reductase 4-like [Bombina bombina]